MKSEVEFIATWRSGVNSFGFALAADGFLRTLRQKGLLTLSLLYRQKLLTVWYGIVGLGAMSF